MLTILVSGWRWKSKTWPDFDGRIFGFISFSHWMCVFLRFFLNEIYTIILVKSLSPIVKDSIHSYAGRKYREHIWYPNDPLKMTWIGLSLLNCFHLFVYYTLLLGVYYTLYIRFNQAVFESSSAGCSGTKIILSTENYYSS